MEDDAIVAASTSPRQPRGRWFGGVEPWALPVFLGTLWGQLFWALQYTWAHGQYYDYGWAVPPIAAWFFWRRWHARPPLPNNESSGRLGWTRTAFLIVAFFVLAVALTHLRIMERFDPIWRIPLLLHGAIVFLASLCALTVERGFQHALSYLPLAFFSMTAVPWPVLIEARLIGGLTEQLLAASVPVARAIGLPVELSGAALVTDGRIIEIDEGCSGIRSFQSLLMAGLFVGEFLMLRWRWRALLLLLAFAMGFAANTMRATALSWIFIREGKATFDALHDGVGLLFLGVAVLALFVAGCLLDRPTASRPPT